MKISKRLNNYWRRPRTVHDSIQDRRVTFLELFYDLVFVAYIAQLTSQLAHGYGIEALIMFVFAFLIGWWAWFNGSFYHGIHGNDDVRSRVYIFIQMFFVIGMIVFSQDAFSGELTGFAICYAAFHIVVGFLWFMTGRHDLNHAKISNLYAATMFVVALLFISSIFVSIEVAYLLWGITITAEILMPIVFQVFRDRMELPEEYNLKVTHSMSVRFGLFTIIVIGEVVVGIVAGFSHAHPISLSHILAGIFWIVVSISIWWNYFDFISLRLPKEETVSTVAFSFLHLPVAILISLVGVMAHLMIEVMASGENLFANYSDAKLFIGLLLITIGTLGLTLKNDPHHPVVHKRGVDIMITSGIVLAFMSFIDVPIVVSIGAMLLCLLVPLLYVFGALVLGKGAR